MCPSDQQVVMEQWVVYDRPTDSPDGYVVRKWVVLTGGTYGPTEEAYCSKDVYEIRNDMAQRGLVPLQRSPEDDPCIVEVWL